MEKQIVYSVAETDYEMNHIIGAYFDLDKAIKSAKKYLEKHTQMAYINLVDMKENLIKVIYQPNKKSNRTWGITITKLEVD